MHTVETKLFCEKQDRQDAANGRRGQAATLLQAVYRGLYGRRIAAYRYKID